MSSIAYRSKVRITREQGTIRKAFLPARSEPVTFGVHSEIAAAYGVTGEPAHPTTLDYLVAAAAG